MEKLDRELFDLVMKGKDQVELGKTPKPSKLNDRYGESTSYLSVYNDNNMF
jgi:hypothetical protein